MNGFNVIQTESNMQTFVDSEVASSRGATDVVPPPPSVGASASAAHSRNPSTVCGSPQASRFIAAGATSDSLDKKLAQLSSSLIRSRYGSRQSLNDSLLTTEHRTVSVPLISTDVGGLGFNINGSMSNGIYVSQVHERGPAKESGKLHAGDRILKVTISFENMVYEDALTILSYSSPYPVVIEAESTTKRHGIGSGGLYSGLGSTVGSMGVSTGGGGDYASCKSQSMDDLRKIENSLLGKNTRVFNDKTDSASHDSGTSIRSPSQHSGDKTDNLHSTADGHDAEDTFHVPDTSLNVTTFMGDLKANSENSLRKVVDGDGHVDIGTDRDAHDIGDVDFAAPLSVNNNNSAKMTDDAKPSTSDSFDANRHKFEYEIAARESAEKTEPNNNVEQTDIKDDDATATAPQSLALPPPHPDHVILNVENGSVQIHNDGSTAESLVISMPPGITA